MSSLLIFLILFELIRQCITVYIFLQSWKKQNYFLLE